MTERRYGCHNRPRPTASTSYVAQSGWHTVRLVGGKPVLVPEYVDIHHTMSTDCRYDASGADRGCAGCEHATQPLQSDEAVAAQPARRHKPVTPGIVGNRFGMLTVLRHVSAAEARAAGGKYPHFVAQCDCGNVIRNKNAADFKSGRAYSCGCTIRKVKRQAKAEKQAGNKRAVIDVTGQRYGMLTAVKRVGIGKQGAVWQFKCDCGNEREIRLKDVRHGNTASCGCLKNADKSNQWKKQPPILDINRPWRKDEQVDDRWTHLVGERAPRTAA